ncbi:broad-complex core protein isoforms 1/2/3/4/5-like isoform X1 [Vanessa cardui]|uniref:broad-complex core protein isoforms 1/2/3/4/5-like isoform X1 n=1 Tax=Vanessa cardui TaxID=171605 RepID=UPI001F144BC2|nr:broad-complex core protein isoforms 1/2/3/4/5-like isoform X1 [Vanessa cardui]
MASDEQFSLCWNNFHANMSAGFHGLLSRGDLVDVTLAAEGRILQAHKLVLSVCSPYFQEMFKMNPTHHPIVFLKDVSHSALRDLLQFMYQGEVNVKQEELASFISTAEQLQVKGLTGNQNEESSTPSKPKPTSRPGPRSSQQRQSVMTKLETDLDSKPSSTPVAIKRPNRPSIASNNSSSSQSGPAKRKCVDPLEAGPSGSAKEEFVTIPDEDENNAVAPKMEPEFVNESMWDEDDDGTNNDETNFGEDDSNMEMTGFDGSTTGDGNITGGGEGGAVGDAQDSFITPVSRRCSNDYKLIYSESSMNSSRSFYDTDNAGNSIENRMSMRTSTENFTEVNCDALTPKDCDSYSASRISSPQLSNASSYDSSSGSSISKTPTRRIGRKRQRRPDGWKDVKRKYLKNLGKEYLSRNGVLRDAKSLKDPCPATCRLRCSEKINAQEREHILKSFWQLGDHSSQWDYIVRHTETIDIRHPSTSKDVSRRKKTIKYFLVLTNVSSNSTPLKVPVCKTMFLNTLSIGERTVHTALAKWSLGSGSISPDRRGGRRVVQINDDVKQGVIRHVRTFQPVELPNLRQKSSKLYLDGDLTFTKMFSLYNEWCAAENIIHKAKTLRQYRDIINQNLNISFYKRKKDV